MLTLVIIIAILIGLTALAETDNGGIGFWCLVVLLGACEFWLFKGCLTPLFVYVKDNPGVVVFGAVSYLVLGVLWSFFRWYVYLKDYKRAKQEALKAELTYNKTAVVRISEDYINPSNNKSRLISWMGYWPLSVSWFLVNKPVTRLYNWIFEKVSATYQQISNSVFKV